MRELLAVLFLLCPVAVGAQVPSTTRAPAPRGDVAGLVGWLHVPFDLSADMFRDDDWTQHATITGVFGFYWNDHWKTEASIAQSTSGRTWSNQMVQPSPYFIPRNVEHRFQYTRFTVAQFYQFGRNDWFHPSLGAGVQVQRRTGKSEYAPAVYYVPPRGTPEVIDPGGPRDLPATTETSPFVAAALKAYMTPRAFFRSDVQVAFNRDMQTVIMHAGFGIDF